MRSLSALLLLAIPAIASATPRDDIAVVTSSATGEPELAPTVLVSGRGFVQAEYALVIYDEARSFQNTFRPREIEFDLLVQEPGGAALRVDLNLITDTLHAAESAFGTSPTSVDRLIEQAYGEWTPSRLRLRAGRMSALMGLEDLDAPNRPTLSRSHVATLALPDTLTGASLGVDSGAGFAAELTAANGWDTSVDTNRSKTALLALAYERAGLAIGLSGIAGNERPSSDDWRRAVDVHGEVQIGKVELGLAALYGEEQGRGHRPRTGERDARRSAVWWGGMFVLDVHPTEPWSTALRLEVLHDRDLVLGIPNQPNLPLLTTLFGATVATRYAVSDIISLALEYRADFARGDVENLSVQRNIDVVPKFWNLGRWFITQTVLAGVLAQF